MMERAVGICVLGMRRTGSNHLFNVLRNFDDLASCGELFSAVRVSGVEALMPQIREITGLASTVEEDPLLRAYARGNPAAFVKIVEEAASRQQKQAYCFKIFEDQLDQRTIEADILARPRMHLMLLARRSLDAYISLQKATLTQEWMSYDTTHVTVTLEAEAFGVWLKQQRAWYGHWLDWAKQHRHRRVVLRYERDVDRPVKDVLRRFAKTASHFDVRLRRPAVIRNWGLVRQDKRRVLPPRVANWPEFIAELRRLGLEREAFGYPL